MIKKAFTLIELLVVIVIIGILATVSTATYSGFLLQSRDTKRITAVNQMADLIIQDRLGVDIDLGFGFSGQYIFGGLFGTGDPASDVQDLFDAAGYNPPVADK